MYLFLALNMVNRGQRQGRANSPCFFAGVYICSVTNACCACHFDLVYLWMWSLATCVCVVCERENNTFPTAHLCILRFFSRQSTTGQACVVLELAIPMARKSKIGSIGALWRKGKTGMNGWIGMAEQLS